MASSTSLLFNSLQLQLPSQHHPRCSHRSTCSIRLRPVTASVSERPSVPVPSPLQLAPPTQTKLPIREIPGDRGLPFVGPFLDRFDYFYNQGRDEYFKSRIQKYQSTILRANVPPGPFIATDPNVIVLLDGKSFPVLFDADKVEKRDVFTGTFMPSTELTGGYRVLSYLDPSEHKHNKLKQLLFFLLQSRRDKVIPEFHSSYAELFQSLEKDISAKGEARFGQANDQAAFNFLARSLFGSNPGDTKLGLDGPKLVQKWVLFQLSPILVLGLPKLIEDIVFHSFRLPPSLVKADYQRLYDFFYQSSGPVLDEAERLGISRAEACHNLVFSTCFNSFGGFRIFFPIMMKWIGRAGVKLHTPLAQEIRSVIRSNGGKVTIAAMEQMPLMKSVVYEVFRIEPPVALQFGRAKKDIVVESHDCGFQVKAGELMFGYQPFATKDPRIFERPEEFVPDRFVGEGENMLRHVLWSNGPETEKPSVGNKQCAGKDLVLLASRLLVVELFMRYDTFEMEVGTSPLGCTITITSLERATS